MDDPLIQFALKTEKVQQLLKRNYVPSDDYDEINRLLIDIAMIAGSYGAATARAEEKMEYHVSSPLDRKE